MSESPAMPLKPFQKHSSRHLISTPIFQLREDQLAHPRTGKVAPYVVLEAPDVVTVVAETDDGQLVLVRQWRHGSAAFELELPAGLIDPGESPLMAAQRELREETGYEAAHWEPLGRIRPSPAYQNNTCFAFYARGCQKVGEPELDEGEDIAVELSPIKPSPDHDAPGIDERAAKGELRSAATIAALYFWQQRRQQREAPSP